MSINGVGGEIAFAFLDVDTVAVGHLLANPACEVLGGGIEWHYLVDGLVVEAVHDAALDVGEVGDHAVGVEGFGAAVDGDDPVVAVEDGAFALVVELKIVAGGYFETFLDVVHSEIYFSSKLSTSCFKTGRWLMTMPHIISGSRLS